MYYIKGLEYLGRPVKIKGKDGATEAKRFVTLGTPEKLPTEAEVRAAAAKNPLVKKAWVMQMEKNKWKKVLGTFDI